MNTKKKNARGITLIALVITIIVLLILAGVTINALSGENGIITKSKEAKIKTEKSRTIEKINLAILTAMTKGDGDIDNATLREELEKEGFDVNENLLLKELISFIKLTIKDLPVKEKERILKKYVQCKTLESIAIEENCSMPAVYYSIKIILEKIKEVLIKNGYDIND